MAIDAALSPDERLSLAGREVAVADATGIELIRLHARDEGYEGAVPALGGEDAVGLGTGLDCKAAKPVGAGHGAGEELVGARVRLDVDAGDGDGVGERGDPDGEVGAVLAHVEAEVGHADDSAAAPAGVDVGGVGARRRVNDVGREPDVRRGYEGEQQRQYVHL